jgi:hypothetical protein
MRLCFATVNARQKVVGVEGVGVHQCHDDLLQVMDPEAGEEA